ncbi:hypothetical protein V6N13_149697 [Hibiscus sabdariffa]|uniref:RING-type E3 ubiquitin transferase n=1 Tax=Hibiscus sabdariffa TaxID=183260 RepID=A0ABR2EI28_9ROSI
MSSSSSSSPSPSSSGKLSPAVLFIIVILAVIFLVSGLLHLLHRFLTKHTSPTSESNRPPNMSASSNTFQRQLQHLFHLHDSGLDQASIDALPVFRYGEIIGSKQPFDCAVCLTEFLEQDKLRLLPVCGHAFHAHCIDTWLMSNSTCPLCRGTLLSPIEIPVFDSEHPAGEEHNMSSTRQQQQQSGVFCVRLGKFRSSNQVEAETSGSNLSARRCFSMGSYQYVVADTNLQVTLCHRGPNAGNVARKGESFSVSKIWQWSSSSDVR